MFSGWYCGCIQVGVLTVSLHVMLGSRVCSGWFCSCILVGVLIVSLFVFLGISGLFSGGLIVCVRVVFPLKSLYVLLWYLGCSLIGSVVVFGLVV